MFPCISERIMIPYRLFTCHLIVGGDSLGQLVNSQVPEIDLVTCIVTLQWHTLLACSFHIHLLVFHQKTGCVAATKLVWTAAILKGSKASRLSYFVARR